MNYSFSNVLHAIGSAHNLINIHLSVKRLRSRVVVVIFLSASLILFTKSVLFYCSAVKFIATIDNKLGIFTSMHRI